MVRPERVKSTLQTDNYFVGQKSALKFSSTGCAVLDCALGGGLCIGRIANIVGNKSTAKTALATEAIVNFLLAYPEGGARYAESEAAYDKGYAEAMGLPLNKVDFGNVEEPLNTIEDFARDLEKFVDAQTKEKRPGIYVLDSLDALSDEAEMSRDLEKGSYGMQKAKNLSIMFRKLTRKIEKSQVLLIIISQVRDNVGVFMGEKHKRSGGRALDFYATHAVWLDHMGQIIKTIKGVKRPIGIEVRAKIKKNKVSLPFREASFEFIFGFGIDDVSASINWLEEVGRLGDADWLPVKADVKKFLTEVEGLSTEEYIELKQKLTPVVQNAWREIETQFIPKRSKYPTKEKTNAA